MTLHEKTYFPSFRHAKILSIRIFSEYKKTWYFRSQKKKEKIVLSYVFNRVGKTIFSTSEINEKVILIDTLAILEKLILYENDRKNYNPSCA